MDDYKCEECFIYKPNNLFVSMEYLINVKVYQESNILWV